MNLYFYLSSFYCYHSLFIVVSSLFNILLFYVFGFLVFHSFYLLVFSFTLLELFSVFSFIIIYWILVFRISIILRFRNFLLSSLLVFCFLSLQSFIISYLIFNSFYGILFLMFQSYVYNYLILNFMACNSLWKLSFYWLIRSLCNHIFSYIIFWKSIHLEVASDSFCFLCNCSWLLVFILYVFFMIFLGFNLYC